MPIDPAAQTLLDDDKAIEQMARMIHQLYRSDHALAGKGGDALADQPWEDLPKDLQAQNWNQARVNARRVGCPSTSNGVGLDLRLVAVDGYAGPLLDQLAADDVERLAIDEHERWARQKHARGYVWGPERVDDGNDLRHPDLVAWGDLDEATRDKDRAPMSRILMVLRSAGLGVADPAHLATSGDSLRR